MTKSYTINDTQIKKLLELLDAHRSGPGADPEESDNNDGVIEAMNIIEGLKITPTNEKSFEDWWDEQLGKSYYSQLDQELLKILKPLAQSAWTSALHQP